MSCRPRRSICRRFCTRSAGFTLIEIMIASVVMGVAAIPLSMIGMEMVRTLSNGEMSSRAIAGVREELSLVNVAPVATLASRTITAGPLDIVREVSAGPLSSMRSVVVTARTHGTAEQVMRGCTYVSIVPFGTAGEVCAAYFSVVAGSGAFQNAGQLADVGLRNSHQTRPLVIIGLRMQTTVLRDLTAVRMLGSSVFSGAAHLTTTETMVPLKTPCCLEPHSSYSGSSGAAFVFRDAPSGTAYSVTITFVFSDGSVSAPFTWAYA